MNWEVEIMKNKIIVVYSSHLGDEEDSKFNRHVN